MQIFEVNMASRDGENGAFVMLPVALLHVEDKLLCSDGAEQPVKQISSKDGAFYYEYRPSSPGKYTVSITWGGAHIPKR